MPLVLTHPTCDALPDAARRALCDPAPVYLTLAEAGDRTLVLAVHVEDDRSWDGPYHESRAYWTSWKAAEQPVFGINPSPVADFLAGLGPVTGRSDAWARLSLVADDMGGSGDRVPSIAVAEDAVTADPKHPGGFIGRTSYVDALSCECSVQWTKVYALEFQVTAGGVVSHDEKMTSCEAWPKSATKDVCGK